MHPHLRAMVSLAALLLASCDAELSNAPDADTFEDGDTHRVGASATTVLVAPNSAAIAPDPRGTALRIDELDPAVGAGPSSPVSVNEVEGTDESREDDDSEAMGAAVHEQPTGFHFAFTHDSTYVVLRARTEPEWGEGPLSLAQRSFPTVIVRAARIGVPSSELTGTRMVLRSGAEVACVAQLGAPQVLRRAYAGSEHHAEWEGEDGGTRATDAQVAEEAWTIAVESELLVAKATAVEGDCAGAHWAHPEQTPPHFDAAPIAQASIVRAFRQLDAYRGYQAAWADIREYDADPGFARWDARPGAHRRIATFRSHDGRRFALVSALAHDGCGDFTGGLWALFEATPRGLEPVISHYAVDAPRALADVDGDGMPEVIFQSELVRASGDRSLDITTPFFDCPC